MSFLRKLFSRTAGPVSELSQPALHRSADWAVGAIHDDYLSMIRECRPHVIAMREVAADAHWSC